MLHQALQIFKLQYPQKIELLNVAYNIAFKNEIQNPAILNNQNKKDSPTSSRTLYMDKFTTRVTKGRPFFLKKERTYRRFRKTYFQNN